MIAMELEFTIVTKIIPERGKLEPHAFISTQNSASFQQSGFLCFLSHWKAERIKDTEAPFERPTISPIFHFIGVFPSFPNPDMDRCKRAHIQTETPSGRGLTLTLKGLCLTTVIATPQARHAACASVPASLCDGVFVCELSQTLSRDRHMGLFMCEQQRFDPQSSGKQNNCAFHVVCLWRWGRQEMRSCWGPWLCVHGAYHKAGPDRELNMNRLLAGPTELMEMRNSSFSVSWNVWRRQAMSFYPRCSTPWF